MSLFHSCDEGYESDTCTPVLTLRSTILADFTHLPNLQQDWLAVIGGDIVAGNEGCGTLLSGESLYFSEVTFGYSYDPI